MAKRKITDIDSVVRTILEENPELKAEFLVKKVHGKTGKSRSTIYAHLDSLVEHGSIFREKGKYSLEKPSVLVKKTSHAVHLALEKRDSAIRDRDKLFRNLLDLLFYSNNMEPYASEYSANKERLKSDYPKIYQKLEKHEKARSGLEKKVHQNKEALKRANLDTELKKPLDLVDAYNKWDSKIPDDSKTPEEKALEINLEKEVKDFVESYKELRDAISVETFRPASS